MAAEVKLIAVTRGQRVTFDTDGLEPALADDDYLIVTLDRYGNGLQVVEHNINFDDHAGLEAEWDAGSVTTLLSAAITSEMANVEWPGSDLAAIQRALIGTNFLEA